MPIYEYKCPECGAETEKLQRMDEPPPTCEGTEEAEHKPVEMTRKVSGGSFILKGGGWASDGYS